MIAEDAWDLITSAFVYERRRCRKKFEEIYSDGLYQMTELRNEDGKLRALAGFRKLNNWVAIEYIAVQPKELFSELANVLIEKIKKMYPGNFTLVKGLDILSGEKNMPLMKLYTDAGFIENPYIYTQASFHNDCIGFPQNILTYPTAITHSEFKNLRALLCRYVVFSA